MAPVDNKDKAADAANKVSDKVTGTAPPRDLGGDKKIPGGQNAVQQAAAPVATLASKYDPIPHYVMSVFCAGGGAYAFNTLRDRRAAAIGAATSAAYAGAGYLLQSGQSQLGYDLGSAASLGLLATVGPRAYATGEPYSAALATGGAMSAVANLLKSYQLRAGKPHEVRDKN